ncbi:chaperonin 10-like protein [Truncatella angustata]|uniref:Chaperonin 10-like protein n=1 Tax=Truncatella angustata TaxID=152316 RepID=A0A9P8UTU1_9PEZI|nr:chaperonin 10-like protein [Truncatella angustata]KAH6658211.1 chaperonin 10-like protein [Truncatella angustata]
MTTRAIVFVEGPEKVAIREIPKPKLRDGYVLVKVHAVGINPTDWKSIHYGMSDAGSRSGCDYAGVVEELGENLGKPFKKGDRIAGFIHGANRVEHDDGSFGHWAVAKADIALRIPDNLSFEQAATLGVSVTTVGQGLYRALELPLPVQAPAEKPEPILIYGGSTATGILGIQFAKLSGLSVVTTASPRHHAYLRDELGADAVFDYRSPTCADDIRAWAEARGQNLRKAWDCISLESSAEICARALASDEEGGTWAGLVPVEKEKLLAVNKNVKGPLVTLGYDAFGEEYVWGTSSSNTTRPVLPGELEHAREFWELARDLLEEGKVKTIRPTVNRGGEGLEGVLNGLEELRQDRVSGEKLVYTLA